MRWPTKIFLLGMAIFGAGMLFAFLIWKPGGFVVATIGGCLAALFKHPGLRERQLRRKREFQ